MDENQPAPRFKVGDFVQCWYTLYQYYYYYLEEHDENQPVHGIIVEVDYVNFDDEWLADIIYVVFCTDGVYRFFVEEEIRKIA